MSTLDFTQVKLRHLITHHVGNKLRDEKFMLSGEATIVPEDTQQYLLNYFLQPFKAEEFYAFTHPVKLALNDMYSVAETVFNTPDEFIPSSHNIARLLYEQSMHPKIKEGELNIAFFTNVVLDDEVVQAIGIFKSETDVPFLKMKNEKSKYSIYHDFGFELKGMDKGCIIFNTAGESGYKMLIVDSNNRSAETQYWKDDFLKIKPIANEFHQTSQFLSITKHYVTKKLSEDFEVTKTDQIDLLNRSVDYFKTHGSFDKKEFETEVLQEIGIIRSFRNFDEAYRQQNGVELHDNFEISSKAVKKQARVFKSVLKLDKNFHIYIHGNRELIEQGIDPDGRKYYKIYFEQES